MFLFFYFCFFVLLSPKRAYDESLPRSISQGDLCLWPSPRIIHLHRAVNKQEIRMCFFIMPTKKKEKNCIFPFKLDGYWAIFMNVH
jgi:hypothetical protein